MYEVGYVPRRTETRKKSMVKSRSKDYHEMGKFFLEFEERRKVGERLKDKPTKNEHKKKPIKKRRQPEK